MVNKERLETIIRELNTQLSRVNKELANLPEGYLTVRTQNGRHYYTWKIPAHGNRKKILRKGITGDTRMIYSLVRKKYLVDVKHRMETDIKLLDEARDAYLQIDMESVMKEYFVKYPELEAALRYGRQSDKVWSENYNKAQGLHDENLISTSAGGIKMRSKGEIIIASRLDLYGIPYRYEEQISHPDVDRVPDFTIKRPRDGKIIYWEHFGLVNDNEYMQENARKMNEFYHVDIVPWDNLIITYDQSDGGIDVRIIDGMIQGWLL